MSFVEPFPKAPEADTPGPVKRVIKQVAALALNIMERWSRDRLVSVARRCRSS